jgi:hypothetical protein
MEGVKTSLRSQAGDFFDTGMQELTLRYDKRLNSRGDYIENYLKYLYILDIINDFFIACFTNSSLEVTFQMALLLLNSNL